jgi:hypothetical protein
MVIDGVMATETVTVKRGDVLHIAPDGHARTAEQ